jgi:hypothetical protein
MKKYLAAVLFSICLLFAFGLLQARADTVSLYFVNVGGQSDGGYYVYPYHFSIDSNATTTPLMCISFTQEINPSDSWNATIQSITGSLEEEAAWLFNDANLHPENLADDQFAAWELFDPGVTGPDQSGIMTMLDAAQSGILNWTSADSASYVLYIPVSGSVSQSIGDYPQTFMGYAAAERDAVEDAVTPANAPAPEPGGLILLGTGLFGLATVLYRRKRSN